MVNPRKAAADLSYYAEIVTALTELLKKDSEVEVRLGCLFVFSRLFVALGVDSLELMAERLREVYRLLRYASQSDHDVGVRARAREVVALMNDVTRMIFDRATPLREDHPLNIVKQP